ncbi:MAG: glycine betaine/L-proline ABC transporter ATP-binding protein [Synechococcaceae cyanobacterium SM2_3_1]|nr:glycine betaine/L-proline ABC transporter ATP-binding protein [Synechococcaceae cyanobacterium SM2_3_1]
MNHSAPKIRIENLFKVFGKSPEKAISQFRQGFARDTIFQATGNVLAVADVSLEIQPGELFVIMGLSGSGKSTLVRCLNRLIPASAGQVYVDGEDVLQAEEERLRKIRRTKMAMVFQRFALFPHRTVVENVEYGLKVQGMDAKPRRQKAMETLEIVGLAQWAHRYPSNLSGGMQQRVGLARALATDPDILLMDEAFGALDPLIRRGMQDELINLQDTLHKTIVFITHDIQEALKLGDRVAVMRDGQFVQVGTPEEIVTRPINDYVEQFTLEVNRARVLKAHSITRDTVHTILGKDSIHVAVEQMRVHGLEKMYVVDRQGRPAGLVTLKDLSQAIQQAEDDIRKVMQTDFPQVDASTSLYEIFHLWKANVPVAVVGPEGRFKGVVEQSDILGSIGRLSKRSAEQKAESSPALSAVAS